MVDDRYGCKTQDYDFQNRFFKVSFDKKTRMKCDQLFVYCIACTCGATCFFCLSWDAATANDSKHGHDKYHVVGKAAPNLRPSEDSILTHRIHIHPHFTIKVNKMYLNIPVPWILWVRFHRFEEFDVISKMAELLADSHGSAGHAGWIASNGALMHKFQTCICRHY